MARTTVVVLARQRAGRSTAAVMGLSKTPRPFSATGRQEAASAPDHFKRLKMLQDADALLADCRDLVEQHGLDVEATRQALRCSMSSRCRCEALPSLQF